MALAPNELAEVAADALAIREDIIRMLARAGSGHLAGALGLADVFALLFRRARLNPQDPAWPERDRIVLSNGHTCPGLYAAMARKGFFPREELTTLRAFGSRLQGHPQRTLLPGLETTSGPLGEGLGQAVGMALAARMDGACWHVWCVASDGEHDEGSTWEAALVAAKYALTNLTLIVDRNNIQIEGKTDTVLPLGDLAAKYAAFGWSALTVDGNNLEAMDRALDAAMGETSRPTCIIANTVPGKGVKSIEGDYRWHGSPPKNDAQADAFLAELHTAP